MNLFNIMEQQTFYEFKTDNAWSSLKVRAFTFHQLHNGQYKINKAEVQDRMEETLKWRKDKPRKTLDIVGQISNVMAEDFTALTHKLGNEIWIFYKSKVLLAFEKSIDKIIR
ncbi:hypothetical protein EC991_002446 [Linnemannia zychae]|nr:hypothetical protein EC991_002446 [Linnemannia zychae]